MARGHGRRTWPYWGALFAVSAALTAAAVHLALGATPFGSDLLEAACVAPGCEAQSALRQAPDLGAWARPYVGWRVAMVPDVMVHYALRLRLLLLVPVVALLTSLCVRRGLRRALCLLALLPLVWETAAALLVPDGASFVAYLDAQRRRGAVLDAAGLLDALAVAAGHVVPALVAGLIVCRAARREVAHGWNRGRPAAVSPGR